MKIVRQSWTAWGTEYSAWEPSPRMSHSTVTFLDGQCYGRIGTRRLPAELEALKPGSPERIDAVCRWHEAQYQEAYALIEAKHPEADICSRRVMGEITTY